MGALALIAVIEQRVPSNSEESFILFFVTQNFGPSRNPDNY